MKKLLFVIPEYSHGGTNKSLENLLSLIDKTKYQISVYCLYEDGGEYYKKILAPYILKKSRLYYWMHDNVWTRKVMGLYNKLTNRSNFGWLYKREVRWLQKKNAFDVVVAYQEGTATEFVSYLNDAVKKVAWIHCDYGAWSKGIRRKVDEEYYSNIDDIVCVSESAKKSFVALFPECDCKAHAIYNVVRANVNEESSKETLTLRNANATKRCSYHYENVKVKFNDNCFNIVSVGRLNPVKQFEKIPEIVAEIKKNTDKDFCWYIIGSGVSETVIKEETEKFGVQDQVVLLGSKDNPYPYMKRANIVACTSDSESFSYVITEAKVLHTPVLSNDFPVAYEVVEDQTGWIANIKDMPQLLTRIINNENGEYDKKKASVLKYEYSNQEILQRIDELFEN